MKPDLIISSLVNQSPLNELSQNKNKENVVVNKTKKSISVVEGTNSTEVIGNISKADRDGFLKISSYPNDIIFQWGRVNLNADTDAEFNFPIAFPNSPLNITASHQTNSPPVVVMADIINNNKFSISISGGLDGENVHWFAVGY